MLSLLFTLFCQYPIILSVAVPTDSAWLKIAFGGHCFLIATIESDLTHWSTINGFKQRIGTIGLEQKRNQQNFSCRVTATHKWFNVAIKVWWAVSVVQTSVSGIGVSLIKTAVLTAGIRWSIGFFMRLNTEPHPVIIGNAVLWGSRHVLIAFPGPNVCENYLWVCQGYFICLTADHPIITKMYAV